MSVGVGVATGLCFRPILTQNLLARAHRTRDQSPAINGHQLPFRIKYSFNDILQIWSRVSNRFRSITDLLNITSHDVEAQGGSRSIDLLFL